MWGCAERKAHMKTKINFNNANCDGSGPCHVGQAVWTCVFACGIKQRMAKGIITEVHSGFCAVDIMSLHGGAPWITLHSYFELEPDQS